MTNPRVVHIAEAFAGGVARHIRELLLGLDGWDQSAIVSTRLGAGGMAPVDDLRDRGIEIAVLPMARSIRPGHDLESFFQLRALIRELQPAIVHCHSAKAGFLGRAAARSAGVPVRIYTPHGLPFHESMPRGEQSMYQGLEKLAGRWTTEMVAVSSSEAEAIRRASLVSIDRLRVIPNGVSIPQARRERTEARDALGIPIDRPVVACVSYLRQQKAPLDWLAMAANVLAQRPETFFLWMGGGDLQEPFLEAARHTLSSESFKFFGTQKDPSLAYRAADIFTLASLWEGLPYALLDAMAWGLPCAVTAVSGCRDLIRSGVNGLLATPGEPAELAGRVVDLLESPGEAERMGTAARSTVERDYNKEQFLRAHDQLYRELLSRAEVSV